LSLAEEFASALASITASLYMKRSQGESYWFDGLALLILLDYSRNIIEVVVEFLYPLPG
jgi:hypothetical protein